MIRNNRDKESLAHSVSAIQSVTNHKIGIMQINFSYCRAIPYLVAGTSADNRHSCMSTTLCQFGPSPTSRPHRAKPHPYPPWSCSPLSAASLATTSPFTLHSTALTPALTWHTTIWLLPATNVCGEGASRMRGATGGGDREGSA